MSLKSNRVLDLYLRLDAGQVLAKKALAEEFGTSERSIQRDIETINEYLADRPEEQKSIRHSRTLGGYVMERSESDGALKDSEILAMTKILLESKALVKQEMEPIIKKILRRCVAAENKELIDRMIKNELHLYEGPRHGKPLTEILLVLASAVRDRVLIKANYKRIGATAAAERILQPLGIMFSDYYFYLVAHKCASADQPDEIVSPDLIIYRVDRIEFCQVLDIHFRVPYNKRFQEGEFRKRVQFMFGGALRRIEFRYSGSSPEAVFDRLPTAKIIKEEADALIMTAEVYGEGYKIWARAQGHEVEILNDTPINYN